MLAVIIVLFVLVVGLIYWYMNRVPKVYRSHDGTKFYFNRGGKKIYGVMGKMGDTIRSMNPIYEDGIYKEFLVGDGTTYTIRMNNPLATIQLNYNHIGKGIAGIRAIDSKGVVSGWMGKKPKEDMPFPTQSELAKPFDNLIVTMVDKDVSGFGSVSDADLLNLYDTGSIVKVV